MFMPVVHKPLPASKITLKPCENRMAGPDSVDRGWAGDFAQITGGVHAASLGPMLAELLFCALHRISSLNHRFSQNYFLYKYYVLFLLLA